MSLYDELKMVHLVDSNFKREGRKSVPLEIQQDLVEGGAI
jgi:hypothetical protein